MKIKLVRPDPDYPFAYAHVDLKTDIDNLGDILAIHKLTLLGRWTVHTPAEDFPVFRAPVLLEDEHVKPRKLRRADRLRRGL